MLGAIVGDIVGSPFTDDSVMTLANAKWLTEDPSHSPEHLVKCMRELGRAAQGVGYGPSYASYFHKNKHKKTQRPTV